MMTFEKLFEAAEKDMLDWLYKEQPQTLERLDDLVGQAAKLAVPTDIDDLLDLVREDKSILRDVPRNRKRFDCAIEYIRWNVYIRIKEYLIGRVSLSRAYQWLRDSI